MSDNKSSKISIEDLFNQFLFRVPIYQRNYAWGEEEIVQLLNDINGISENENYYLGTLVLSKSNEFHDVIDGQQRLTTLYLLHKLLSVHTQSQALCFESRPKTTEFFKAFIEKESKNEIDNLFNNIKDIDNFKAAINEINQFFEQDLGNVIKNIEDFKNKCFKQTFLFTTELPENTDVNHYFEIMNNRGEQLEKHEILKAIFLNDLDPAYCKEKYAKIWEACSQLDNHVQYYFDMGTRKLLFTEDLNTFPDDKTIEDFLTIKIDNKDTSDSNKKTISDENKGFFILDNHDRSSQFKQNDSDVQTEKYKSIIDFENFLLQVLSFVEGYADTKLDDKNLLMNFGYKNSNNTSIQFPNSLEFIKKLLQVRFLFDKYVVKREIDEDTDIGWKWRILNLHSKEETFDQNNTFSDNSWSDKLVMIQSMFHVSYTQNTNKKWLKELLGYLIEEKNRTPDSIFEFLYDTMRKMYHESVFDTNKGLQTPRAVFNFLDFLLWELYYNNIKGEGKLNDVEVYTENKSLLEKLTKLKDTFFRFRFTQRSSIEHFFPQAKIEDLKMIDSNADILQKNTVINSFGNLCLISSSSNSSYSKDHPSFKKSKGRSSNESLKQHLMFESMDIEWGQEEINNHQDEMMKLLDSKFGGILKSQTNDQ